MGKVLGLVSHLALGAVCYPAYGLLLLLWRDGRALVAHVVAADLVGLAVLVALRYVTRRPRPPKRRDHVYVVPWNRYSFPSGHAVRAFAVAVTLPWAGPDWCVLALPVACVIALSRITLARHYPSDVLAGMGIAALDHALGPAKPAGSKKDRNGGTPLSGNLPRLVDARAAGAALAAAVVTGKAMLGRPSVRASLGAAVLKLLGGPGERPRPIEAVGRSADRIVLLLQGRAIAPDRIGVDGAPGSGKSTVARALAERLGMRWICFDHENMNVPRDFAADRTVYEHQRLFRTQGVDVFDAIVYVDEPVEVAKARVLERARREARLGALVDLLDYEKLTKIGKLAFEICDGEPASIPGSNLVVKVRPPRGFRAAENTASRLRAAGRDPEGLTKEEMLFLLTYGKPQSGLMAYFRPGAYNEELLGGLLAGIRRYLAE